MKTEKEIRERYKEYLKLYKMSPEGSPTNIYLGIELKFLEWVLE